MKILVVGGGNVGYYLTRQLLENKNQIMIIEQDPERCAQIEQDLGDRQVTVTHGDGTDARCLRDAGIYTTEILIAVTGHDQNNLAACQIAKGHFGVSRTVARVKNPKNIGVFRKLGVDSVISSTQEIANTINEELGWAELTQLVEERSSGLGLSRETVGRGAVFAGHTLKDISLQSGVIIIALSRDGKVSVPDARTELRPDDEVILWGAKDDLAKIRDNHLFSGDDKL